MAKKGWKLFQDGPGLELNFVNITVVSVLALVLFQGLGFLIENMLGIPIRLGPVFVLIPFMLSAIMSIAIFKKLMDNRPITRQDMFPVIVTMIIAVIVMFLLPNLVPEIFEQSFVNLCRSVGLGGC